VHLAGGIASLTFPLFLLQEPDRERVLVFLAIASRNRGEHDEDRLHNRQREQQRPEDDRGNPKCHEGDANRNSTDERQRQLKVQRFLAVLIGETRAVFEDHPGDQWANQGSGDRQHVSGKGAQVADHAVSLVVVGGTRVDWARVGLRFGGLVGLDQIGIGHFVCHALRYEVRFKIVPAILEGSAKRIKMSMVSTQPHIAHLEFALTSGRLEEIERR
jgi:hypothetical protein